METKDKNIKEYSIPFRQKSGYKWTFHLLSIILIVIFTSFVILPLGKDLEVIILKIFFAVLAAIFLLIWLYTGVFKKSYVEINEEDIRLKTFFGRKVIKWTEVYDIQVFTQNNDTILGIVLKEKIRKRKESFLNILSDMYGGMFSVRIPLSQFTHINIEMLYCAMVNKLIAMRENCTNNIIGDAEDYSVEAEKEVNNYNFLEVILKLFLISLGIGLIYGFSIYIISKNVIMIPIFGSLIIIYFYNKFYKEEKINVVCRFIIGLLCAFQVFVAVILAIILEAKLSFNITNIVSTTKSYFDHLTKYPFEQGVILFIAVLSFGFGAFQGYKFKFQKKLEKVFMKKLGKYYYKKDGRIITIYLTDPALYDDQKEGMLVARIHKDCLIEREKKSIRGIWIPVKAIEELGINISHDEQVNIDNKTYYKIGLNCNGDYQPYVFPCTMIMNNNKEVEIIQIEI